MSDHIRTIALPGSTPCWVTVRHLPESLARYAADVYDRLFELRPSERGKVVLMGETKDSPRWHQSFLKTPEWDDDFACLSYMFGSRKTSVDTPLPIELQPFLRHVNEGLRVPFNQVVVMKTASITRHLTRTVKKAWSPARR